VKFGDLDSWIQWQQSLYSREIDLTLDRLVPVYERMGRLPATIKVVTVAGTNGKGSCVATLEVMLTSAGHTVGTYTSPHLYRYNERIRLSGLPVSDDVLMSAFQAVEDARQETPLTYFEFGTLAALAIFSEKSPGVVILEVGLGGRLDAVNSVDADVRVITTIGLDHQAWLGNTREAIATEKAGIMRPGRPLILGDRDPPKNLLNIGETLGVPVSRIGVDFDALRHGDTWSFRGSHREILDLPTSVLHGPLLDNAACAMESLSQLDPSAMPAEETLRHALAGVSIPARLQRHEVDGYEWIIDLAHNEPAAQAVARYLEENPIVGNTRAVLGMLREKDAGAVVRALNDVIDEWILVDLEGDRGRTAVALRDVAFPGNTESVTLAPDVDTGCRLAEQRSSGGDRILALGSFHIAGPALSRLGAGNRG
jgi:dihydrofolate synthase/folylpolyglutamate synthase